MLGTNWRVQLLSVAVVVEWVTGLGLIIVPRVVVWLLFGADIDSTAVALARVAGIALCSLSLGCWMGRREAGAKTPSLVAMLTYNILVAPYLLYLGIGSELVGILLWPAVVVHAAFTLLFAYSLVSRNERQTNKT